MNVKERITEDLKVSMKAQNKLRTSVLRMILADIKIADTSRILQETEQDTRRI